MADTYGVSVAETFVGNGSDEVLKFAFQAFFCHGAPLDVPSITYSFYPVYANLYGVELRKHPLNNQWEVDLDALANDSERSGDLPTPMRLLATLTPLRASKHC